LVAVRRQRKLHEDAVDAGVGVQGLHLGQKGELRHARGQPPVD
jgi:hypothetical protein